MLRWKCSKVSFLSVFVVCWSAAVVQDGVCKAGWRWDFRRFSIMCAEPTVSSPPETLEDTTTRSLRLNVSSVYECVCVCVCVSVTETKYTNKWNKHSFYAIFIWNPLNIWFLIMLLFWRQSVYDTGLWIWHSTHLPSSFVLLKIYTRLN